MATAATTSAAAAAKGSSAETTPTAEGTAVAAKGAIVAKGAVVAYGLRRSVAALVGCRSTLSAKSGRIVVGGIVDVVAVETIGRVGA